MVYITAEQAKQIAPHSKAEVIVPFVEFFNKYAASYDVTTPIRVAHFFAQAAHESDEFKTLTEYASGEAYEGRKDLGNTQPGDGKKFKGRGAFQLTGRANYQSMSTILGVDLVANPEKAATPEVSARVALEYWKTRKLNALADADDVLKVTKKVNGGQNGLAHRKECLQRAKIVLGINGPVVAAPSVTTGPTLTQIQNRLIALQYQITADGVLGPRTQAAVRLFQKFNNIPADGIPGPATIAALFKK